MLPGTGGPCPADRIYLPVSYDFIVLWEQQFRKFLWKYGRLEWSERFDCDNYADLYRAIPQIIMPEAPGDADSLAIATIWYHKTAGPAHAVIAYCDHDMEIHWREPQPLIADKEIRPTPQEASSVFFRRI